MTMLKRLILMQFLTLCSAWAESNLFNGNAFFREEDIGSKSPCGIQFETLERFYNSRSNERGDFGIGWSHSWSDRLVVDKNAKNVTWRRADGSISVFASIDPSGDMNPSPMKKKSDGSGAILTYVADGWRIWSPSSGRERKFDRQGRLMQIADWYRKNKINLLYKDGRIAGLESRGKSLVFKRNEENLVSEVQCDGKSMARYSYNHLGLLSSAEVSGADIIKYEYSTGLWLVSRKQGGSLKEYAYDGKWGWLVMERESPFGSERKYVYSQRATDVLYSTQIYELVRGRYREVERREYDRDGRLQTITRPGQSSVAFRYQANSSRPSQVQYGNVRFDYEYDDQGRLLKANSTSGIDLRLAYNSKGLVSEIKSEKLGLLRILRHDSFQRPMELKMDGVGLIRLVYDDSKNVPPKGRLVASETRPSYQRQEPIFAVKSTRGQIHYHLASVRIKKDLGPLEILLDSYRQALAYQQWK